MKHIADANPSRSEWFRFSKQVWGVGERIADVRTLNRESTSSLVVQMKRAKPDLSCNR